MSKIRIDNEFWSEEMNLIGSDRDYGSVFGQMEVSGILDRRKWQVNESE